VRWESPRTLGFPIYEPMIAGPATALPSDRKILPSTGVQLRAFQSLDELAQLRLEWEKLLSSYPLATTFSTWEWLSSWWRAFAGEQQLLVLAAFSCNSELVGLLPLSISRLHVVQRFSLKLLRLMGDGSSDSDNLDLPMRPGYEEQIAAAFIEYLGRNRHHWDVCQLNTLPVGSPMAIAVTTLLQRASWMVVRQQRVASAIPLPGSFEEYRSRLSSEDQKNLARYSRRLEKRYATQIYRCADASQISAALEAMFRLHQARWQAVGKTGSFAAEERRRFYYDLSRLLLDRGWLELWVLELNGEVAAVQYAFRYGKTVFQLQEGFDPSRSSDRVGFVLRGRVLESLISEGVTKYDFLAGEPGYKARWSAELRHYNDLHFARRFSLGSIYLQTVSGGKSAKEWLRVHLPKSAWAALHHAHLRIRGSGGAER